MRMLSRRSARRCFFVRLHNSVGILSTLRDDSGKSRVTFLAIGRPRMGIRRMHRIEYRPIVWSAAACAAVIYLYPLALATPLLDPDEGLHATISQSMVERGDYVVPRFLGEPFRDKPILYFAGAGPVTAHVRHERGGGAVARVCCSRCWAPRQRRCWRRDFSARYGDCGAASGADDGRAAALAQAAAT